ncbi:MAG: hypothetical protein AABX11_03200 [Nanoarchaeota archaeon]
MVKRKVSWENIKNFLVEDLKNKNTIMTFGTIGSTNIEHDIDVIITKKPSVSSADFFREVHDLYDNLDSYLQSNFSLVVKRFARFSEEPMIKSVGISKKGIFFHTMIYVSFPQIEKDWSTALFPDDNIKNVLKGYTLLKGNSNDLFSKDFSKLNYCDNIFNSLYLNDLIHSTYPNKAILSVMNHVLYYLFVKRLKSDFVLAKNLNELREKVYSLCELIDKINVTGKISE